MTPAPERDHRGQPPEGDAYVRQQLASIDGSLFSGMPSDDRYESGVPEGQRGNSIDFIQMTGLTRPPLRSPAHGLEGSLAQTPIYEDLNPSGPVSFYEKGVADVDDTLGRDSLLGGLRDATLDTDLVPSHASEALSVDTGASRSAQAFRDIVAGLQRGDIIPEVENELATEPAEVSREVAADQDSDDDNTDAPELEPYGGSASGALLALVEELESAMGVASAPPETSEDAAALDTDPVAGESEASHDEQEPSEVEVTELEADSRALPGAPAAEIDDDDFDALLASWSGTSNAVPEEAADESAQISTADSPQDTLVDTPEESPGATDDDVTSGAGIADDWDALLDTMTVRGAEPEPAPELGPAPELRPVMAPVPKSPGSGALAEAEQLMQALEKRPKASARVSTPEPVVAKPLPSPAVETSRGEEEHWGATASVLPLPLVPLPEVASAPAMDVAVASDGDAQPGYDYSAAPSRRRSRRHSRVARRGRKIVKAVFYVSLLGGLISTLWIFVVSPMLVKDEDLSAQAERLMAARDYSAASQTYLQLASRIPPGDTERSSAEFRAAYALTLGPEHSGDDTKRRYETALSLFKKFTEDYPQHPKRARALSIIGRLHFELQDFEQAIVVLRDQVKPADDPAAALSMLRYLARAYSMTGNYEQAETSYLQAATLPGNYNAEADYLELGDLFRQRAGLTKEPADREPLEAMAMSYWRRALQVPGLAPGDRNVLEERLQWLSFTDKAEGAASGAPAPAEGAANPESAPAPSAPAAPASGVSEGEGTPVPAAVPAEEGPAPAVSSIPVAADEAGRAEVPGAELEALVPAVTPAGE